MHLRNGTQMGNAELTDTIINYGAAIVILMSAEEAGKRCVNPCPVSFHGQQRVLILRSWEQALFQPAVRPWKKPS